MFIKQILIQGFKSYKDQTVIEPFSPHHNVVVGRNGSGKSNFFAACRFVLSDAYGSMSREERLALLHEGAGPGAMTAFVEIHFDNSDHRFPTGKDEVVLRRTIGLKKDEYSIDRKSVSKAEVSSLLESAGFSRSNPYYIVPQGRVTSLCNAKDGERLQLLKEVAGTRVYEQRRIESLKIMEESDMKRKKIDELLKYIEDRLAELEEEKEELRLYYDTDKMRRGVEYTIYQREQNSLSEQLEDLEEDHRRQVEATALQRAQSRDQDRVICQLEAELKACQQALQTHRAERDQLDRESADLIKARTNAELALRDSVQTDKTIKGTRSTLNKQLSAVENQIAAREHEFRQKLLPLFERALETESKLKLQFEQADLRRQQLLDRQGRASRFKTKKERNSFLQQEIESLRQLVESQVAQQKVVEGDIVSAKQQMERLDASQAKVVGEQTQLATDLDAVSEQWTKARQERDALYESRKMAWRQEAQLEATIAIQSEQVGKCERAVRATVDKNISMGLESVKKIAARLKLAGVYGPLFELFDCDPIYSCAVEVTAGNSLFNVVVDTDETAEKILQVLNAEKSGRLTFIPLNRVNPEPVQFPTLENAVPLIKKLNYNPLYAAAMEHTFGKTVVCADLAAGNSITNAHNVNTITLDGDRVDRKGALTGGFHDVRRSRLDAVRALKAAELDLRTTTARSTVVKQDLAKIEQQCAEVVTRLTNSETRRRRLLADREALTDSFAKLAKERDMLVQLSRKKTRAAELVSETVRATLSQLSELTAELDAPMQAGLRDDELAELEELTSQTLIRLQKETSDASEARVQAELAKNEAENDLEINLNRKRTQIVRQLTDLANGAADGQDAASLTADTAQLEKELNDCRIHVQEVESQIAELDKAVDTTTEKLRDVESSLEKCRGQQQLDAKDAASQQKYVERYLSKRGMLVQKKQECAQKIRELGALPEQVFEQYRLEPTKKLVRELHKASESLKKYGHVNKKAFEQYNTFTKQRDSLLGRKEELDGSASAIEDLIKVLDQRKDEAIERTFTQVAKNFAEIFEKLVPLGRGSLIIQRSIGTEPDMTQQDSQAPRQPTENYIGVGITVSFNSKNDEGLLMRQLSGGQKSLVALALVFAIQRCDPAPFYLFDEIDANLDAAYRASVAAMIHELAADAQFITTTFRPELLRNANKFYGVTFRDRVSRVGVITKDDAMNFVEQEAVRA